MKRLILLLALMLSGCFHETKPVVPVLRAEVAYKVIAGDNWRFNAPPSLRFVKRNDHTVMFLDDTQNVFVIVRAAPFSESFMVLLGGLLNVLHNSGMTVNEMAPLVWLGNTAATATISRESITVFYWLGLVDGEGVAFGCGGMGSNSARNRALCSTMAESFHLQSTPALGR